ncbi:Endonuclease 8 [compost metagenome]
MEMPFMAGDTVTGSYNDQCKVYDRGGEPCLRGGGTIIKTELSGRKVFYCPDCQHDA